jgi:repressor LexA
MGSKEELGTRIKTMRLSRKMTQADLAKSIGQSPSSITMYETGRREPDFETLEAMADVFNVPMSFFVADGLPTNVMPITAMKKHNIPLIGSVAAGQPITANESVEMYVDSPSEADYALKVQGDSMEPTYLDGDVVFIRKTPDVQDGTIAVVLVDDSACLKHVYKIKNGVQLVSDNPKYPPMIRTWPEYDVIRILGIVVGFMRMYKKEEA